MSDFDWMRQGACRGMDTNLFFPLVGKTQTAAAAIKICNTCPVRLECLNYALDEGYKDGIYGGVQERKRRDLRRDIKTYSPPCSVCGERFRRKNSWQTACSPACVRRRRTEKQNETRRAQRLEVS